MNKFPIVEMLAFFSCYQRHSCLEWRTAHTRQIKQIRSCHSQVDGGVKKSFYTLETRSGEIIDLEYNEEELTWKLKPSDLYPDHVVDRVLALIKRHKHTHSRAHRIIPFRFEIIPTQDIQDKPQKAGLPLVHRVQPYRFQSGKLPSTQVTDIVTRHLENVMVTKHLHYVVKTDQNRFFHLVYILDEAD